MADLSNDLGLFVGWLAYNSISFPRNKTQTNCHNKSMMDNIYQVLFKKWYCFFLFFICINLENYRLSQSRKKELGFLPRR